MTSETETAQTPIAIPTRGGAGHLKKKFKVCYKTVQNAIEYKSNSEKAIRIREYAIKKWGHRPLVNN